MRTLLLRLAATAALSSFAFAVAVQAQPSVEVQQPSVLAQPPAVDAPTPGSIAGGEIGVDTQAVAAAQAKLAWSLIDKLGARGGDVTVSPASLASALGVVALGADAKLAAAIAKVLGFAADNNADRRFETFLQVRGRLGGGAGPLRWADRIVFSPATPPNRLIRAGLDQLNVPYSIADLSRPDAAAEIDSWVKTITGGAIPEILGGPVGKVSLVSLNALYFKSTWKTPFDPQLTAPAPFTGADGKAGDVAMMRLGVGTQSFRKERRFVAVDLPFVDERFSLVVVTTADKPAAPKDFAKMADWLAGTGFAPQPGDLALPRFSAAGRSELMGVLDTLGLEAARRSPTALVGFAPGATLSQVVQRAMIDVDEEGAEAAAATAVMGSRALVIEEGIHMSVDKPFIYALRDRMSGLILIAGYVGHPPKGRA